MFLLGTMSRHPMKGDVLSWEDMRSLNHVCETMDLDGHVVLATYDVRASKTGQVKMADIRENRQRVLDEINTIKPEVVMALGPNAVKSVFNKGNLKMEDLLRQRHVIEGLDCPVYITQSLEYVAAKPGVLRWLLLDTHVALHGFDDTEWGDYDVLVPDDPRWGVCPDAFAGSNLGPLVGFDLETYPGLNPWAPNARIRMAIISNAAHKATVVQLGPDSQLPAWLQEIVKNPDVVKAGSNIKFDYKWLRRFGVRMQNMHDTSVTEHILDETNPMKGLKFLTFIYAPWLGDYSREHRALVAERGGWEFVEDDEQYAYAGADGEASYCTAAAQMDLIRERDLLQAYRLSHDLYRVLCEIEHNGAVVDMKVNENLEHEFQHAMYELEQDIQAVLGPINLGSAQQLAVALKETVPHIDLTKTKINRLFQDRPGDEDDDEISTDRATLEREAAKHPVIEKVLRWRRLAKLYGTYVKGMREKYVDYVGYKAVVFTSFRQDVVETNRLSSQGPNLQNQPSKPDPDDPHPIPLALDTKRQFVSRFDGGWFMEADLSQAELRVAAMLSGDEKMLGALETEDVHTAMAATFLNKRLDDVTKLERHRCKRLTFLTLYGGGANTLSKQLDIYKEDAKRLLHDYFATFTELDDYIQGVKVLVKRDLSVGSIFGFRRRFRQPRNWNSWDGWRIERQAWNHLVQNTAACVLFVALIDMQRCIEQAGLRSKIVLTVHDSIGIDVHPDEVDVVERLVRECMEHPNTEAYGVKLTVPLVADIEIGRSWGDKTPIDKWRNNNKEN